MQTKGKKEDRGKSRKRKPITIMAAVEDPGPRRGSIEEFLSLYKPRKTRITLRLDADVVAWFKSLGDGYQTRINKALRKQMRKEMGK